MTDHRGNCPTLDFIEKQQESIRRKLWAEIRLCAARGPDLHNKHKYKKFKGYDGLFELKRGPKKGKQARIAFFYGKERQTIVCSHGFMKAETAPKTEIDRAKCARDQYLQEHANA